jgi:hypothetical protein
MCHRFFVRDFPCKIRAKSRFRAISMGYERTKLGAHGNCKKFRRWIGHSEAPAGKAVKKSDTNPAVSPMARSVDSERAIPRMTGLRGIAAFLHFRLLHGVMQDQYAGEDTRFAAPTRGGSGSHG